ncbi:MAG TPA: prephenate dehydrogenase/arogenate dehydrogenase family protein [Bryobacteraceae bacterium]|nr:prephenate dehydrogenase/arogenate dehydrogenase family protein [Bryobacteraceae bacterium]
MESVAIVGVGLIGGSFGLALRAAGFKGRIAGVSSPQTIEQAIALAAIDHGINLETAAVECDLIYLAQPISAIEKTLEFLGPIAASKCLITDAGSTKVRIVETASKTIRKARFLGGHPMAGKESRGVTSACADLFRGRPYILTPNCNDELDTPQASGFINWLERCGAHILSLNPQHHDRAVAFTSHMPQMASTALAVSLANAFENHEHLKLAGPGLFDMSRLALSSFEIWKDIVSTNKENIEHALDVYIDKLTELRDNLQTQRLGDVFATATEIATRIRRQNNIKS